MSIDNLNSTTYRFGVVYAVLSMMIAVSISNYLVQFPINHWLTWGAFPYPICFLVTELTNRFYGSAVARRVVYLGFILGVSLSLCLDIPKIAAASGIAFLISQLLDIAVFNRLREYVWWFGPLVASCCASAIDTAIFTTIAFWGENMPVVTLAIGDFSVKMVMDLLMLAPFRLVLSFGTWKKLTS